MPPEADPKPLDEKNEKGMEMGRMMGITDDDIDVTTAAFYDLEKVQKEKTSEFAFDHFEVLE